MEMNANPFATAHKGTDAESSADHEDEPWVIPQEDLDEWRVGDVVFF